MEIIDIIKEEHTRIIKENKNNPLRRSREFVVDDIVTFMKDNDQFSIDKGGNIKFYDTNENGENITYITINKKNAFYSNVESVVVFLNFEIISDSENQRLVDRVNFDIQSENGIYRYAGHGTEYKLEKPFDKEFYNLLSDTIKSEFKFKEEDMDIEDYKEDEKPKPEDPNEKKIPYDETKLRYLEQLLNRTPNKLITYIISVIRKTNHMATVKQHKAIQKYRFGK